MAGSAGSARDLTPPGGRPVPLVEATGRKTGWVVGEPGNFKTTDSGKKGKRVARKINPTPT